MYSFCPHCGQTIEQNQVEGRMLVCERCGKNIGFVGTVEHKRVDDGEELIRGGTAARCSLCQQLVELRGTGATKKLVPHYRSTTERKICPGSGKPAAS